MEPIRTRTEEKKGGQWQAARINKNLIVNGDLARIAHEFGLTGLDLHLLVTMMAYAQHRKKRGCPFRSHYQLLKLLGWPTTPEYYDRLDASLYRWEKVKIEIDRWRPSVKMRRIKGHLSREGKRRRAAKRRRIAEKDTAPRVIPSVWKVNERESGGLRVLFSSKFIDSHKTVSGYFVLAWPHEIRPLRRHRPEILLSMLLTAFKEAEFKINLPDLMDRIGLTYRDRPSAEARILKAIDRINAATDRSYFPLFHKGRDGTPIFTVSRPKKIITETFDEPYEPYKFPLAG